MRGLAYGGAYDKVVQNTMTRCFKSAPGARDDDDDLIFKVCSGPDTKPIRLSDEGRWIRRTCLIHVRNLATRLQLGWLRNCPMVDLDSLERS